MRSKSPIWKLNQFMQILLTRAQVRIMVIWYLWIKNDSKTGCFSLILDGWTNHVTKLAVKMVYHSKMDWPSRKLAIRLTIWILDVRTVRKVECSDFGCPVFGWPKLVWLPNALFLGHDMNVTVWEDKTSSAPNLLSTI